MKKQFIDYEWWWEKITDYAKIAGRITSRPVLILYFVLKSPETPASDKRLIIAALSYLILPINLISMDKIPLLGWIDEAISIWTAYEKIAKHITPGIEWEVDMLLDKWFPQTHYILLPD